MGEGLHVCNYTGCGRAFGNPVRLTDLSRKPHLEIYYACPYCFSKVDEACECESEAFDVEGGVKHFGDGVFEISVEEDVVPGLKIDTRKELRAAASDVICPHQVGYLKTRPKDEPVPDCCLTCPRILQCMV